MSQGTVPSLRSREVKIRAGAATLTGDLTMPEPALGLVIFAHGGGSSRTSPRNKEVASELNAEGFATFLLDLLTPEEEQVDRLTAEYRFDIDRLATRVVAAIDWATRVPELHLLPLGLFGASTGAAAALVAAAERPAVVRAVVSRGGRPDLSGSALAKVRAATLLLVGGLDDVVISLNRRAMAQIHGETSLEIVAGATHLFPERGALEMVSDQATRWFVRYLTN